MTRYFYSCAHEQFPPDDLLVTLPLPSSAGFDGIGCSDHFQPWWEPRRVRPGLGLARRARAGHRARAVRLRRHAAGPPLPPGAGRSGVHDARGDVPRPRVPRHRLGRVAQRVAARHGLAGAGEQLGRMEEALEIIAPPLRRRARRSGGPLLHDRRRLPAHAPGATAADLRLRLRASGRRDSPDALGTGSGRSPTPRPSPTSSTPTARVRTRPTASRARSSCMPVLVGPETTSRRSRRRRSWKGARSGRVLHGRLARRPARCSDTREENVSTTTSSARACRSSRDPDEHDRADPRDREARRDNRRADEHLGRRSAGRDRDLRRARASGGPQRIAAHRRDGAELTWRSWASPSRARSVPRRRSSAARATPRTRAFGRRGSPITSTRGPTRRARARSCGRSSARSPRRRERCAG